MRVILHDRFSVTIFPETKMERIDLAGVARIRPEDDGYLPLLTGETESVTLPAHKSATEGGGGWMRVTAKDATFIAPYWDRLAHQFGATRADLDLAPFLNVTGRIKHTYLAETLTYHAMQDCVWWTSVFPLYPYIGEVFPSPVEVAERGQKEALNDLYGMLGQTVVELEFIPVGDRGLYRHNPNYGRYRPRFRPGVRNDKLWKFLCQWWYDNQASDKQKELIARAGTYWNEPTANILYYDKYEQSIPWAEFAKLT